MKPNRVSSCSGVIFVLPEYVTRSYIRPENGEHPTIETKFICKSQLDVLPQFIFKLRQVVVSVNDTTEFLLIYQAHNLNEIASTLMTDLHRISCTNEDVFYTNLVGVFVPLSRA